MNHIAIALLVTLLAAPQEETPLSRYKALVDEFGQARKDLSKAYRAAETKEVQGMLRRRMNTLGVEYAPRFLELAKDHPSDTVAFDALSWIVTAAGRFGGKESGEAIELLATNHVDDERLSVICERLRLSRLRAVPGFLETILEKSPHRNVQGLACYSLATQLKKSAATKARAEKLLERIVAEYADVPCRSGTLGAVVRAELFEARNLVVGKAAPDIVGKDLEGVEFKLSDYRGKVVVLDFWGNW